MAKLTRTDTSMSVISQLNLDKIMARQPTQKHILGNNLRFKRFSYNLFKKEKKNGRQLTKKTCPCTDISGLALRGEIMALMVPDGATTSHDAVLTYNGYRASFYVVSSLLAYVLFLMIQGFSLTKISRYSWQVLYSLLINTNVFVMLVMSSMVSGYITCYAIVIATTVLVFLKLLQIPKLLLHYVSAMKCPSEALLVSTTKCVKRNQASFRKLSNTTSAAPNWKLINEDVLLTVDVYSIEGFCVSLGILLVWGVIYRLFFYVVRRFYSKNDGK